MYAEVRDFTSELSFERPGEVDHGLKLSSPGCLLALLRVNKQIADEATSCFYRINTFYGEYTGMLLGALQSLAPSRRQHITHLAFDYTPQCSDKFYELYPLLLNLTNLGKLDVRMDESTWFRHRISRRGQYYTAPTIPGIEELAGMGERFNVRLRGNCPNITAHFEAKRRELWNLDGLVPEKRKQPARKSKPRKKVKHSCCATRREITNVKAFTTGDKQSATTSPCNHKTSDAW